LTAFLVRSWSRPKGGGHDTKAEERSPPPGRRPLFSARSAPARMVGGAPEVASQRLARHSPFIERPCSRESYFRTIHIHGMMHSSTPTETSRTLLRERQYTLRPSGLVSSFFAASKIAAAVLVWIGCLSDPREKALLSVNLRNRRGTDFDSPILPTIGRRRN
jgi:hypothetical protein